MKCGLSRACEKISMKHEFNTSRRYYLLQAFKALSLGLLSTSASAKFLATPLSWLNGSRQEDNNQSIRRLIGVVRINGKKATLKSTIRAGDTIETGEDGSIVFVVKSQVMLLHNNAKMTLNKPSHPILTLSAGRLLSVSRQMKIKIKTPTAVIGVKGTGWYVEAEDYLSYFCTCYGEADIRSKDDKTSQLKVVTIHHETPVYIFNNYERGNNIIKASRVINHTDDELRLLEELVGRKPPFGNKYPKGWSIWR